MFKTALLISVQHIVLLLQVCLKTVGLSISGCTVQGKYYHLRKHEVLEFLNAKYLPACLYSGRAFHADKSYSIVCPHTKTVNKVTRDQNASSAKTWKINIVNIVLLSQVLLPKIGKLLIRYQQVSKPYKIS